MTDTQNANRGRIVITGLGVISAAGCTVTQFWQSLNSSIDLRTAESAITGKIEDYGDLEKTKRKLIRKALKLMNRETHMGVAAGQQALADSGALEHFAPEQFGVCFGADNVSVMPNDFQRGIQACSDADGTFGIERWGEDGIDEMEPLWILKCLPNMPACHLAIINDLQGPSNTITQRDISANVAIGEACRSIQSGDANAMLVGATGTTLNSLNLLHAQLEDEVLESDSICRPFDKRRTGSAAGEGAGAIVLENLQAAIKRGARIYGEILGTASTSRIHHDGTGDCRTALAAAMRQTLRRAGNEPCSIGHIHAHGLGTWKSDIAEAQAIANVFGKHSHTIPLVAAKSHLANSAAGSGMLEMISSVLAMQKDHLFPIRNYEIADTACPVHPVRSSEEPAGSSFLNLNMFGRGLASCTAIGKYAADAA